MKKLQALYNDDANKIFEQAMQEKSAIENLNFLIDLVMVTTDTKPVPEELKTFTKAWNHPNASSCMKWQEAIKQEFDDMNEQQVWHKTSKSLMPPNCRCLKNKWVFKIKHNGMYHAHLVECGYSQVPGIDFLDNYSPVGNDVTFRILLLMVLHFSYLAEIVNIETVCLYSDLEEEIYMECPQGMSSIKKDDCIILNKCIYGLVEA